MAKNTSNIYGMNVSGSDTTPDQYGHFIRDAWAGSVSGMAVSQAGTPNMTVLVGPGTAILTKNTVSSVIAEVKASTAVTISTADTANPRIDAVIVYEDTDIVITPYIVDGVGGRFKIAAVVGTPGASPSAPSDSTIQSEIGAGKSWARLANVTVPTSTTTIINSNISDQRTMRTPTNLAADSVGSSQIAASAVGTSELADASVTGAKLASYKVIRDDNGSISTESAAIMRTGWGWIQVGGSATSQVTETVTFNAAFTNRPIVVVTYGGDAGNVAASYGIGGGIALGAAAAKASNITTTNFVATITAPASTTWPAAQTIYYQWIAIGT